MHTVEKSENIDDNIDGGWFFIFLAVIGYYIYTHIMYKNLTVK